MSDDATGLDDASAWESVPALTFDPVEAVDRVCDAYHDAVEDNWDGEGARAVSLATLDRACRFMLALPDGLPLPDVDPSPRGSLLFGWHAAPRRRLTVSVGPTSDLPFAVMLGRARYHGTAPFDGEGGVPLVIVDLAHTIAGWA